jgi:probable H4MPT-linked C1 transfer pathway protein
MSWIAIDVGGANLKAADGQGWACIEPFALWRSPEQLPAALRMLLRAAPHAESIALTMTGELCDCFETKAEGVRHIVSAVQQVAHGRGVYVYLVDGRFVSGEEACESPLLAAASNWHALARFACRFLDKGTGLLIDIGSTTTDIIPLVDGQPLPTGFNDTERLLAGELVYTGVGRTPICAVTKRLPWRGEQCPVAAELFATTADAYVLLGCIKEQHGPTWTADGRPLSRSCARSRLARMFCADATTFSDRDALQAAAGVRDAQVAQLQQAVKQVAMNMPQPPDQLVAGGAGEFLISHIVRETAASARTVSLAERLGVEVAVSATAHALAVLASENASRE